MSESTVREQLVIHFPENGRYSRPVSSVGVDQQTTILGFVLDPTDGRYNAEYITLSLSAGRVEGKRYHRD